MPAVIAASADLLPNKIVQTLMAYHLDTTDLPLDLIVHDGAADEEYHQHDPEIPKREFCR
jgi:hypothetical protein